MGWLVGCSSPGTHLDASVRVAFQGQELPSAAVVTVTAEGYIPRFEGSQAHDPLSGIDAKLELDGAIVPMPEVSPGKYASAPRQGFPETIRLHADGETVALPHVNVFSAGWEWQAGRVRVTIAPPVDDREVASVAVVFSNPPDVYNQQLAVGATTIDLPPFASAKVIVQRMIATPEDDDGLRLGGRVNVTRELGF
jgi:hypothetical protein